MAIGPQARRLRNAVDNSDPSDISGTADEWTLCAGMLRRVAAALASASDEMKLAIGGETGPAVDAAFKSSATAMTRRAGVLDEGAQALRQAQSELVTATADVATMSDIDQPTPYRAPLGNPTEEELQKQADSRKHEQAAQQAYADQEERARKRADQLDATYAASTATMKKIHGEPDPVDPKTDGPSSHPVGGGGNGGGSGRTIDSSVTPPGPGGKTPTLSPVGPTGPGGTPGPVVGGPGHPGGPINPVTPGSPGSGVTVGAPPGSSGGSLTGTGLGVAGATVGGVGAGALGAGLSSGALGGGLGGLRGGSVLPVSGTAQSAVRGIGTTGRAVGSSTIGRSGAASGVAGRGTAGSRAGAGAAGRGTTGRGSGRGAGGRGAGGRGAGGRGGSGVAGRSGRGKDDEDERKRDLFDVDEDWIDDEGVAPGVLD